MLLVQPNIFLNLVFNKHRKENDYEKANKD